jgi:hypothetical protein
MTASISHQIGFPHDLDLIVALRSDSPKASKQALYVPFRGLRNRPNEHYLTCAV